MKAVIFLSLFLFQGVSAQTRSNSQARLPTDEAEAKAFEKWNQEETRARQREERIRILNEERARGFDPLAERQEEVQVECKCPPQNSPTPNQQ